MIWKVSIFAIAIAGVAWINYDPPSKPVAEKAFVESKHKSQWYYLTSKINESSNLDEELFYRTLRIELEKELTNIGVCVKRKANYNEFVRC